MVEGKNCIIIDVIYNIGQQHVCVILSQNKGHSFLTLCGDNVA